MPTLWCDCVNTGWLKRTSASEQVRRHLSVNRPALWSVYSHMDVNTGYQLNTHWLCCSANHCDRGGSEQRWKRRVRWSTCVTKCHIKMLNVFLCGKVGHLLQNSKWPPVSLSLHLDLKLDMSIKNLQPHHQFAANKLQLRLFLNQLSVSHPELPVEHFSYAD